MSEDTPTRTHTLAQIRNSGIHFAKHPEGFDYFRSELKGAPAPEGTDPNILIGWEEGKENEFAPLGTAPADGWTHVGGCPCRECIGEAQWTRQLDEYARQRDAEGQLEDNKRAGLPVDPDLVRIAINGPSDRISVETFLNYCPEEAEAAAKRAARDGIAVAVVNFPDDF